MATVQFHRVINNMSQNSFTLPFEKLPTSLPIFPLPNAVVMPGSQLPLNIFEPRYLNMVFDALAAERMIGMVQPDPSVPSSKVVPVYRTGTAGRITFFNETSDGRLMIVLTGVCRFDIREEIPTTLGYRRVLTDWSRFRSDFEENVQDDASRSRLMPLLRNYFASKRWDTDWEALDRLNVSGLVNQLTSVLPFEVPERQLLVEALTTEERLANLIALLRCEAMETSADSSGPH